MQADCLNNQVWMTSVYSVIAQSVHLIPLLRVWAGVAMGKQTERQEDEREWKAMRNGRVDVQIHAQNMQTYELNKILNILICIFGYIRSEVSQCILLMKCSTSQTATN